MITYLVFHIVGYTKWDDNQINPNMVDKVVIRLIDTTYESALERAKKLVERDNWILAEVVEYNVNQSTS